MMAIKEFNCKESMQLMEGRACQRVFFVHFIKDSRNNSMLVG